MVVPPLPFSALFTSLRYTPCVLDRVLDRVVDRVVFRVVDWVVDRVVDRVVDNVRRRIVLRLSRAARVEPRRLPAVAVVGVTHADAALVQTARTRHAHKVAHAHRLLLARHRLRRLVRNDLVVAEIAVVHVLRRIVVNSGHSLE